MDIVVRLIFAFCLFLSITVAGQNGYAAEEETIIVRHRESTHDVRPHYSRELLTKALNAIPNDDRVYTIKGYGQFLSRARSLEELRRGNLTVFDAASRPEWEENTIPIRIPILMGLQGYRINFIRKQDQTAFSGVKSVESLKNYTMGGGNQWSISIALKRSGFPFNGGNDYESLFRMLAAQRFDYFPRGVNEIYPEFEARRHLYPSLAVEQNFALYIPLPSYFFVTPKRPDLARRLEQGLTIMVETGALRNHLVEYFKDDLSRADLKNRRILRVPNDNLSDETPLNNPKLWLDPTTILDETDM